MFQKKVIIIGGGWYGCYTALLLQDLYEVTLIEKEEDIFMNSSYYNQNRLHLGFHYSRDHKTRILCKEGYHKFFEKFSNDNIIDKIQNNLYLISNDSILDYESIFAIYKYENYNFDVVNNTFNFNNINNNILLVDECVINSTNSKKYFKKKLKCNFIFNKKVNNIEYNNKNVIVFFDDNSNIYSDLVIDCTYNHLNLSSKNYKYEKTISLLYKKISDINFDALTVIDGNFMSLYPHDIQNNIYTLTDVEYTPLIVSNNVNDILNYKLEQEILDKTIINMIDKIKKYYPNFENCFKYDGYFLSNKTKLISNSDSRECIIENIENRIITINCGKISGIFDVEKYFINNKFI